MNSRPPAHRKQSHREAFVATNLNNRRRSTRMALHAAVELSGEDRHKRAFKISAAATNLNRHGATLKLNCDLTVGSQVTVRNKRGAEASANIVTQIAAFEGASLYAIEFVETDERAKDFWGISFPTNAS